MIGLVRGGLGPGDQALDFTLPAADADGTVGLQAPAGQAAATLAASDGFDMTTEDQAEHQRPLQAVGHFLIGDDGVIRWARAELTVTPLPTAEELHALLR